MKKTSKSLLLKQGAKGIFKFKVQFIIIIVLAFLAIFILTTSITLRDRLNNTYNKVVKSVDKFDYFQQDVLYGDTGSFGDHISQNPIITTLDYNNVSKIQNKPDQFNVAFNATYYGESFITKAFQNSKMQELFADAKYQNSINQGEGALQFRIAARKLIIEHFYMDLMDQTSPANTPVKQYLASLQDVSFLENDLDVFLQDQVDYEAFINKEFAVYAINIADSILAWFAKVQITYQLSTSDLYVFVTGNDLMSSDPIYESKDYQNWIVSETNKYKISDNQIDGKIIEADSASSANELLKSNGLKGISAPIVAINFAPNDTKLANDFVDNAAFKLQSDSSNEDWSSKFNAFESETLEGEDFQKLFYEYEYAQEKDGGVYDWILKGSLASNDLIKRGRVGKNIAAVYYQHLKVVAAATNIEMETRKEFSIFDNVSQLQFRAVILEPQSKFKTQILNSYQGGRMPLNKGEILVSEQFARSHNISLFQNVKIGNQPFVVVGFATDTLSYYPIADDDLPIPQTKNSGIIYATAPTFKVLTQDTSTASAISIPKQLVRNFVWLNESSDQTKLKYLYNSDTPPILFNDSSYRYSWTLQPKVVMIYTLFTVLISVVIAMIAFAGLIISTKKSIKANAKQIGILKAIGYNPATISLSYVAQALFITLFVIPLSWGIGLVAQSGYVHLFIPYFSIQMHQVQISILPLIIGYIFFGLFAILISFFTAYRLTAQPVMDIIKVVEEKNARSLFLDKINQSVFKNAKFTLKFSINLASSNRRNIYLMTIIILITSFLVSIGFSIPAIVQSTKEGYYRNINYANSYDYVPPVSNAPLSKGTLAYADHPDFVDKQYVKAGDTYIYKDPNLYFNSSHNASPVAKYMYLGQENNQPVITNTFRYLASDQANNVAQQANLDDLTTEPNSLLNIVTEHFGNNFYMGIGSQFSVGTIEQVMGIVYNSLYDVSDHDSKSIISDQEAQAKYNTITENLTQAVPLIIGGILAGTGSSTGDWKDQILSTITKAAPPFVQNYIQDPSRVEQYAFGYGVKKIIKNEETFATKIKVNNDKFTDMSLTGINQDQKAYGIKAKDQDKLFISADVETKLNKVFNGKQTEDIIDKGYKYYDATTNTLSAPILANNQSNNTYKLKKNSLITDITTKDRQLQFITKNDQFENLPKDAWVYDDSDFLESDYFKIAYKDNQSLVENHRTGLYDEFDDKRYLNLQDIDNNKLTFRNLYPQNNQLTPYGYLFNDFAFDGDLQASSYVRPYYEYKNVQLYLPENLLANDQLNGVNKWANYTKTPKVEVEQYFKDKVENSEVPPSVKHAWEQTYGQDVKNSKYIMINPYAMEYSLAPGEADNRGLQNILDTDNDYLWYSDAIAVGLLQQQVSEVNYLNQGLKINLQAVGTLDSYNGNLILIDQTFANLFNNYSTAVKYDLNNNTFEPGIIHHAGEPIQTSKGVITSNYDKYQLHDEQEDIFVDDWATMLTNGLASLEYTQMMWNNAKLSNLNEPIDLTTGLMQVTEENNGLLLLSQKRVGNITGSELRMQVASQKLLSTEKDLINQITQLAVSIAMLIIVSVIITSSLLIILVGDIYITHYQRFMILMKSFGYSNWKVQKYSFGTVTILSAIAWVLATAMGWGMISLGILLLRYAGLSLPFVLSVWPIIASLAVVMISYFGSLIIASKKVRKNDPAEMLNETNE